MSRNTEAIPTPANDYLSPSVNSAEAKKPFLFTLRKKNSRAQMPLGSLTAPDVLTNPALGSLSTGSSAFTFLLR